MQAETESRERPHEWMGNLFGVIAILLWSSTIAFARIVTDTIGTIAATAYLYLAGGMLLCIVEAVRRGGVRRLCKIPRPFLLVCGSLFVAYMACLFGAIGLAGNGRQVVEVGLLNYLWPALVIVFSIPILGYRARWGLLIPGLFMGLGGVVSVRLLAAMAEGSAGFSFGVFLHGIRSSPIAYLLGLCAGITWGLYSNLVRKLSRPGAPSGTPIFALATGIVFAAFLPFSKAPAEWSSKAIGAAIYLAVLPIAMGYIFWEIGMRSGNVVLLGSLSFFTPVLSTLISCVLLKVWLGPDLLIGCALVVAGAWVCKLSVRE